MQIKRMREIVVVALIGAAGAAAGWGQCTKGWKPTDGKPGLDSPSEGGYALAVCDDGRGPALFLVGKFSRVGDIFFEGPAWLHTARWDGWSWEVLPDPVQFPNGVSQLVEHGGILVGSTNVGIFKWDGYSWSYLGPASADQRAPLLSYGGALYAKNYRPGTARLRVWNGANWSDLALDPLPAMNVDIQTLAAHDQSVYLGGQFSIPNSAGSGVAHLTGSSYELVGSYSAGAPGSVHALLSYQGELIAGCGANGGPWRNKGNSWDRFEVPLSLDGVVAAAYIRALFEYQGDLIVGGWFTEAGTLDAAGIARWNGIQWRTLSGGGVDTPNAGTCAFCEFNGEVIVAMQGLLKPLYQYGFGRWTGAEWKPLGLGFDNAIRCFAVVNGQLHAGGFFRYAGGEPSNRVAAFDGAKWNPRDSGMNDWVLALGSFNGQPVAGGSFTQASGQPAGHLARWNGQSWQAIGPVDGRVYAVRQLGPALYIGGAFAWPSDHIARFDGAVWSGLAGGVNGNVRALHDFAGQLVAGGEFTSAGGVAASHIAAWTGSQWQALGAGMNDDVHALLTYGGRLIAAGEFTQADGSPASRIAAWDGAAWQPLGDGLGGPVWALAEYEGELIVGGRFSTAGGQPAMNIARWDGAAWHALDNGVGNVADEVRALAVIDGDLHVGGSFTLVNVGAANERICAYWARWGTIGPPGDADHDNDVDQDDMDLILFNFGRSARPGFNGDVNEDMVVDQDDLDAVLFNFGGACP